MLEDPWGPEPRRRDLLADSVCENGRLAGHRLSGGPRRAWDLRYDGMGRLEGEETTGGAFLSPALSYDGQTILFAYVECQGDRQHRAHTDPTRGHWAEGRSYHLFRVDRDGSRLRQLTDGTWNDFAPCWLPNGRIAFISERRGGYLRCGRVCPTYTLFDRTSDTRALRGSVNLFYDYIFFSYDDFRDLRVTGVEPGTEPFFSFNASVVQAFFSLWF